MPNTFAVSSWKIFSAFLLIISTEDPVAIILLLLSEIYPMFNIFIYMGLLYLHFFDIVLGEVWTKIRMTRTECDGLEIYVCLKLQGVPKKIGLLSSFEFLGLGGVFLGVKNNSKNFGNKKNIGLYSKILSKWAFFIRKMQKILSFHEFMAKFRMENFFKWHKS